MLLRHPHKVGRAQDQMVIHGLYPRHFGISRLPITQASISIILKKGKDSFACTSYWPISLLNVGIQVLSKLVA